MKRLFGREVNMSERVHVTNPVCAQDVIMKLARKLEVYRKPFGAKKTP